MGRLSRLLRRRPALVPRDQRQRVAGRVRLGRTLHGDRLDLLPPRVYTLLGLIAQITGISAAAAWAITGIVVQVLLVVVIGVACALASGKAWTAILAPGPFLLGVFATFHQDAWYTQLSSHGVLWGPFAVLFPLNGEAFGLCVGSAALTILILAATRWRGRAARIAVGIGASAAIGAIANLQTYSFLTAVYLASFAVAAYGLVTARRWWLWALSAALIPLLFLVGPRVAENSSQLIALMLGLTPAIPGLIYILIKSRGLAAIFFAVAGLAAAPSVVGTYLGLANGDPFLVYRVASSKDLGVPILTGVIASIVLAIPLILVFLAGIHQRHRLWIAYPVGVAIAWILLAGNDRWGANQEPYRMWIDSFMLIATTLLPVLLAVARRYLSRGDQPVPVKLPLSPREARPGSAPEPEAEPVESPVGRRSRLIAIVAVCLVLAVAALSAADWARFFVANLRAQMITLDSPRQLAIAEAIEGIDDDSLLLVDPCIDPLLVKATTGVPIAWMNYGMAWPEEYQSVLDYMASRGQEGVLDLDAARGANAHWLVTDSECDPSWADDYDDHLELVDDVTVPGGATISLWRLT